MCVALSKNAKPPSSDSSLRSSARLPSQASGLTTRTFARSQSRAVDRLETPLSDDEYEDSPYAEAPPQIVARLSEGGKHARGFDVYPPLATVPASFMYERRARARKVERNTPARFERKRPALGDVVSQHVIICTAFPAS